MARNTVLEFTIGQMDQLMKDGMSKIRSKAMENSLLETIRSLKVSGLMARDRAMEF